MAGEKAEGYGINLVLSLILQFCNYSGSQKSEFRSQNETAGNEKVSAILNSDS